MKEKSIQFDKLFKLKKELQEGRPFQKVNNQQVKYYCELIDLILDGKIEKFLNTLTYEKQKYKTKIITDVISKEALELLINSRDIKQQDILYIKPMEEDENKIEVCYLAREEKNVTE